jgi:WD40 repeat protein
LQTVALWSLPNRKIIATLPGWVKELRFSPTGDQVALPEADKVRLYQTRSGEEIATFACPGVTFRALDFSPSGERLVAGSYTESTKAGRLHLWNLETLHEECDLEAPCDFLGSFQFTANGASVAFVPSRRRGYACTWALTPGSVAQVWKGVLDQDGRKGWRGRLAAAIGGSPTRRLAVVSEPADADYQDNTIPASGQGGRTFLTETPPMVSSLRVLDTVTGRLGRRFGNGTDWLLSPDGKTVATRPVGKDIELWDVYLPPRLLADPVMSILPLLVLLVILLFAARRFTASRLACHPVSDSAKGATATFCGNPSPEGTPPLQ